MNGWIRMIALRSKVVAIAVALLVPTGACMEAGAPDRTKVAADDGEKGVQIRLAGPGDAALLVPVRINGSGPYDFILDTGATLTCVDRRMADSLGLPEARGRIGMGTGIRGGTGSMRLVEIDSVAVGEARAERLIGCAVDLEQFRATGLEVHGLLGLNFLTSFRVTLDFGAERLILSDPAGPADPSADSSRSR